MRIRNDIRNNPYIPNTPTNPQISFLMLDDLEALYGGAAGGGKSDALLMSALMYVHVKDYAAIIFRLTFTDLSLPDALMDRAADWLSPTDAQWDGQYKTWNFPSGATLSFGYMEYEKHKYRYQSAAFQYIGFDELTQFPETRYRYLFSRLRKKQGVDVPLRMRGASNPGNIGHEWVMARFDINGTGGKPFIPAKLSDNKYVDRETYIESLNELDPVTRQQLLDGDWSVREAGNKFKREWFKIVEDVPNRLTKVRYWDTAATEPKPGTDPDYTCGVLMGLDTRTKDCYVLDVIRVRRTPGAVKDLVVQTAWLDGKETKIYMEQEPGASGKSMIYEYQRALAGFAFKGDPSTGSKDVRANPYSSYAYAGNVYLKRGMWNGDYLDELEGFNFVTHDDQVDGSSGAFNKLFGKRNQVWSG